MKNRKKKKKNQVGFFMFWFWVFFCANPALQAKLGLTGSNLPDIQADGL